MLSSEWSDTSDAGEVLDLAEVQELRYLGSVCSLRYRTRDSGSVYGIRLAG